MFTRTINQRRFLDDNQIAKLAPSVFATEAADHTSSKYAFIPTTRVLNALRREGWEVTNARQSAARKENGHLYAKHALRLAHRDSKLMTKKGDTSFEMLLTNSHNATSGFIFHSGLWRMWCSNGAVCQVKSDKDMHQSIRHIGFQDLNVIEATYRILDTAPKLLEHVEEFSEMKVHQDEKIILARAAHALKYEDATKAIIKPEKLLTVRRQHDYGDDLWTTFNVLQENMVRGGLRGANTSAHRRQSTRDVKSIDVDIKLNKALWTLTTEFAKLKQGYAA